MSDREPQPDDELDPVIDRRFLTDEEKRARSRGRMAEKLLEPVVRPRIAAHLGLCRAVLDVVDRILVVMIERFDIDPEARTRAGGLWLLMGRCVGQQRAVLTLVEAGMAVEAQPLDRVVKEMTNLITAMAARGDVGEKLARRWLADEAYVNAQAARRGATLPFADPEREKENFGPLGITSMSEADKRIYDYLSRTTHARRASMLESFYPATRQMARGAGYPLLDQVRAMEWASSTTGRVMLAAMSMTHPFYGQDFVVEDLLPMQQRLEELRERLPLDPQAIANEVGLGHYPFYKPIGGR